MTQRTLSLVFVVACLMVFSLSACRRGVAANVGGAPSSISQQNYQRLVRGASHHMRCHPRLLNVQEVSAGVFSVHGCGQVREYAMVCRSARCAWSAVMPVEQVAMRESGCGYGLQVIPTGPVSRQVNACGRSMSYQLACSERDCRWVQGGAPMMATMQSEGSTVIVVPDDGQYASVPEAPGGVAVVPEPSDEAGGVGAEGTLQALLATQLDGVRQCSGGQSVQVVLQWDADGVVTVHLQPPHAATPLEQCVRDAIGEVQIQSDGGTGTIQVTL